MSAKKKEDLHLSEEEIKKELANPTDPVPEEKKSGEDTETLDKGDDEQSGEEAPEPKLHRLQHLEAAFLKEVNKYAKGLTLKESRKLLTWVSIQLENG